MLTQLLIKKLLLISRRWRISTVENSRSQRVGRDPFEGQTTLSRGSHIWNPAYHIFNIRFLTTAELELWSNNRNNLMVGITTTWEATLKGWSIRKVENHHYRNIQYGSVKWRSRKSRPPTLSSVHRSINQTLTALGYVFSLFFTMPGSRCPVW